MNLPLHLLVWEAQPPPNQAVCPMTFSTPSNFGSTRPSPAAFRLSVCQAAKRSPWAQGSSQRYCPEPCDTPRGRRMENGNLSPSWIQQLRAQASPTPPWCQLRSLFGAGDEGLVMGDKSGAFVGWEELLSPAKVLLLWILAWLCSIQRCPDCQLCFVEQKVL